MERSSHHGHLLKKGHHGLRSASRTLFWWILSVSPQKPKPNQNNNNNKNKQNKKNVWLSYTQDTKEDPLSSRGDLMVFFYTQGVEL